MINASAEQGEDFARAFARSLRELPALPPAIAAATRANVFDTLACATAGRDAPGVPEMRRLILGWGGAPQAAVLWSDARLPAPQAAWLNGIFAHACDYDDTHDAAILHAGVSVVPAAMAAAEVAGRPVSGAEFLRAVAVGLELICRLGVATRIGIIESGFIYSSLLGYFAAAAAAAVVMDLDEDGIVNALGIAFTQAGGTHQVTRDAATTKRMQPGFAARAGVVAAEMARAGIRGAQNVFEGADGLSRIYLQGQLDPEILRDGLWSRWHMADLSYKPYPCCRFNHTAIDAALAVRATAGFDPARVRRIRAGTNRQAWEAVATPLAVRQAPTTAVQAQFSICYTVACALATGEVSLGDFTAVAFARPEVARLATLVEPEVDAGIEREWGRSVSPTALAVESADGSVVEARVDLARGGRARPMSEADSAKKLADCAAFGGFDAAAPAAFVAALEEIGHGRDVAAGIRRLAALG